MSLKKNCFTVFMVNECYITLCILYFYACNRDHELLTGDHKKVSWSAICKLVQWQKLPVIIYKIPSLWFVVLLFDIIFVWSIFYTGYGYY